ncbi:MAG: M48 family metallopeptidase [Bacteroidota bacterium]
MKKYFLLSAIIFSFLAKNNCVAQTTVDFNHYQPLQASGNVPLDFQLASQEKFDIEKQQIDVNEKKYSQKLKSKFYLENSIDITHVLKSGRVLFGDPISEYLSQIMDSVLKNDPITRDSMQIYYLRSDEVNAFTSPDGIIFVSAGLISQLSSEAQLAFILCHEIQHFKLKHGFSKYKRDVEIVSRKGDFKNLNYDEAALSHFHFSRELESEADMHGLELYLTTPYATSEVNGVFDVLLYSYLPFEIDSMPRTFFNDGEYKMPDKFFTNKLNEIDAKENDDDEKSTHPNIYKRRTEMANVLTKKSSAGTAKYLFSEAEFKKIRNISRFEVLSLQLRDHNYEDAFYSSYLLLKEFPESEYLNESKAAALYFMAQYKVNGNFYDIHHSDKEAQGSIQQVYYFFNKIPDEDLGILATKTIWDAHFKFPKNEGLAEMSTDILKLMDNDLKFSPSDFTMAVTPDTIAKTDTTKKNTATDKYSMIKQSKTEVVKPEDEKYYRIAFYNLLTQADFVTAFNSQLNSEQAVSSSKKKKTKGGLGISHLLVANPFYVKLDYTKDQPERYLASENSEDELNKQMQFCAQKVGLKLDLLDNDHLKAEDVNTFNNMIAMNDWFEEAIDQPKELQLYNTSSDRLKNVADQYGTDNVSWMGIVSAKVNANYYDWYRVCVGFVWFPLIPVFIYQAVSPNFETDFLVLVVNSNSGKFEWKTIRVVKQNDSPSVVKSNLYYILQQIKAKKK